MIVLIHEIFCPKMIVLQLEPFCSLGNIHALVTPNFPFGSSREIAGEYVQK